LHILGQSNTFLAQVAAWLATAPAGLRESAAFAEAVRAAAAGAQER
jgi:hypothetical protein